MGPVSQKQRLHPAQARTVADRRYNDAKVLRDTKENAHANGAMYLAGIALELLLKALLIERHPWLQGPFGDRARRTRAEQELFDLCYVRHDLEGLLDELSDVQRRLTASQGARMLQSIKRLCAEWSIHIRYSTQQADIDDARNYLDRLAELRPWLR